MIGTEANPIQLEPEQHVKRIEERDKDVLFGQKGSDYKP